MRLIALLPLTLLAACQVSEGNDSVTVSYNEDVAENAAADIAAGAREAAGEVKDSAAVAAGAVKEGAQEAGATIRNTDIDVDVKTDGRKAEASEDHSGHNSQ